MILSERHAFYLLKHMGEDTAQFVAKLRKQTIMCQFNEAQLNKRVREQFVVGISCIEATKALLGENIIEVASKKTVTVEHTRREAQNQLALQTLLIRYTPDQIQRRTSLLKVRSVVRKVIQRQIARSDGTIMTNLGTPCLNVLNGK